jgi:hypothetical protein
MTAMPEDSAARASPGLSPLIEAAGDLLDRLVTLDLKGRGAVDVLYRAARARAERSLTMRAAAALKARIREGGVAVLCTGFPVRPWISLSIGETDGPPGVAALARAISAGLNGVPLVTAPAAMRDQVVAALRSNGILVVDAEAAKRAVRGGRPTCVAAVIDFPIERDQAAAAADRLLAEHQPSIIAAVEHPGANHKGVYHSSIGVDISEGVAKIESLFTRAAAANILTMSFIDMPNEIGAAHVDAVASQASLFARDCGCPCGGGTAGSTDVDILVVGTIVNWAVYATVAALGILLNDRTLLVTREHDGRAIEALQLAGGIEGVSGSTWPASGVDGIPTSMSGHVVELVRQVAEDALAGNARKPF